MDWIVYILKCSDGSLYTGITNNIENRVKVHQNEKSRESAGHGVLLLGRRKLDA